MNEKNELRISSRPKKIPVNGDDQTSASFNPIFSSNWPKASDNYATKHRNLYDSPYIDIELDSTEPIPKQYDTYKPWYRPQYELNSTVCLDRNTIENFLGISRIYSIEYVL